MTIADALEKLISAVRLRHFSHRTEQVYRMWLQSYMKAVGNYPTEWSSEKKWRNF